MKQVKHNIDPESTKAVTSLRDTKPKNVGEVRKLTGLLIYYRRYIQHFSRIAKPLYDLLKEPVRKGQPPRKSQRDRSKSAKQRGQVSTREPVNWPSKHQAALEKLISAITNPPVMAYPDYTKPFILHTDVSERGLGAALYQKQDGQIRVIAYGSRTLTPAERNCHRHSSKHEFLALKWTITEQLRDYLYYAPHFTVYTDSNPLTYVLTTAKLNATGNRWVAELSDFHFTVKCRPGSANRDADSLFRNSCTKQVDLE